MAGTQYGALNFTIEEEKKQVSPLRKSGAVAAVVVAVCVMFFAGRVHKSLTTPFSHEEVMNVASTCRRGQFIGGCTACSACGLAEFSNGGCTLFKDTFCSFCDPISHCPRQNQRCSSADGQKVVTTCTACECEKKITNYHQKTLEQIEYQSDTWDDDKKDKYDEKNLQFSCFFTGGAPWTDGASEVFAGVPTTECRACTVCPKQFYQKTPCNKDGNKDTVCEACTVCERFEYTAEPCRYGADTVCAKCTNCAVLAGAKKEFRFQSEVCTAQNNKQVYEQGSPTVCTKCAPAPKGLSYVVSPCAAGDYETGMAMRDDTPEEGPVYIDDSAHDTVYAECAVCAAGEFVNKKCDSGLTACDGRDPDPKVDDSAWNALVKAKAVKGDSQSAQCGQYKMGHDEQCTACSKNAGCEDGDKQKCAEGESTQTTENSEINIVSFRTRQCKSKKLPEGDGFGDATYDTCKTCKDSEYIRRNCSPQCAKFEVNGICSKSSENKDGPCKSDETCVGGFCDNQCKLVKTAKEQEATEDGDMAVNTRGVQVGCLNCPDNFRIDDETVSKKPGRMGKAGVCADANKKCQEYAEGKEKDTGMSKAPKYSTCNSNCNDEVQFTKFANCCKDKSLGSACEWERTERACLTEFQSPETGKAMGKPYLVRSAGSNYKGYQAGGLDLSGETPRRFPMIKRSEGAYVFVRWCRQMCEDHADCQMFSVKTAHADEEGTESVTETSKCKLYKDTPADFMANKQAAPLDDDVLAAMDTTAGADWTCAQGAAVNSWHQGSSGIPAEAGFKCDGGKMGINQVAKCASAFCNDDKALCCVQSEDLCYRKDQQYFLAKLA